MPEEFVVTPAAAKATFDRVNAEIRDFWIACWEYETSIEETTPDFEAKFKEISNLKTEWDSFYKDASAYFHADYTTALSFEGRLADLHDVAVGLGIPGLPSRVTPIVGSELPSLTTLAILLAGIVVLIVVVKSA